ncbi:MAG: hypothetical protein ACPGEG_00460 [Salibacteraceae bacterium]
MNKLNKVVKVVFVFLIYCTVSCMNDKANDNRVYDNEVMKALRGNGQKGKWEGIFVDYYSEGGVKRFRKLINDKHFGLSKEFYKNGEIKSICYYFNSMDVMYARFDSLGNHLNSPEFYIDVSTTDTISMTQEYRLKVDLFNSIYVTDIYLEIGDMDTNFIFKNPEKNKIIKPENESISYSINGTRQGLNSLTGKIIYIDNYPGIDTPLVMMIPIYEEFYVLK